MSAPPHFDERSIFSYTPPTYEPTAEEIARTNTPDNNNVLNNEDIIKKYPDIVDCPSEVHCTLPDGLTINNHRILDQDANWGLCAAKLFLRHSLVFINKANKYVHNVAVDFNLIIDPDGPIIPLNTHKHLVACDKGVLRMIAFGALLNHSCDPSCYLNPNYPGLKADETVAVIALRDIQPNEELTVDYNLFAYDMPGYIKPCCCGMPSCRGYMFGFKHLSETEQEKLLPYAQLDIQVAYWLDKQKS